MAVFRHVLIIVDFLYSHRSLKISLIPSLVKSLIGVAIESISNLGWTDFFVCFYHKHDVYKSLLNVSQWNFNLFVNSFFFLNYLATSSLSCSMWCPWPGMELEPSALGAQSLRYWTASVEFCDYFLLLGLIHLWLDLFLNILQYYLLC